MFLSIVIPVYNAAKSISRCLNSIWSQNLPKDEYEVICIDDHSSDESVEVLREMQTQHAALRVISHPENRHAGGARNTGMRVAKGHYLLFIDADDYFHPQGVRVAFEYLKQNLDVDILTCNFARELSDAPNDVFVHQYASCAKLSPLQYIHLNHVPFGPCQWLFKRELVIQNQIWFREYVMCEDVDWTHRIILKAQTIQYQPFLLCHYVIGGGTQTALSYAKPVNVYAYMSAGKALYEILPDYRAFKLDTYLLSLVKANLCQGLKYYFAMYDPICSKRHRICELIPADVALNLPWEIFRRFPGAFSLMTNLVCPLVCLVLKLRAKWKFRGIRLR